MSTAWITVRHCPACGTEVELKVPDGDDRERSVCPACATIHYINPKIIVGSVCTQDQKVLLCRRAIEPRHGYWTIPAGFMELGETAEEGAIREAFEEAFANIAIDGLLATYSVRHVGQVQLLYHARLLNRDIKAGIESLEVGMFDFSDIPWHDIAFPTVTWALRRAQSLHGTNHPPQPDRNPDGGPPPHAGP